MFSSFIIARPIIKQTVVISKAPRAGAAATTVRLKGENILVLRCCGEDVKNEMQLRFNPVFGGRAHSWSFPEAHYYTQ